MKTLPGKDTPANGMPTSIVSDCIYYLRRIQFALPEELKPKTPHSTDKYDEPTVLVVTDALEQAFSTIQHDCSEARNGVCMSGRV